MRDIWLWYDYEIVNIVKCEDKRLDEYWFLFVVVLFEALPDAVANYVVVGVLQLD